jgi:hypothetical protein
MIRAAIDAQEANGTVRANVLIGACIEHGIDAGTHICRVGVEMGFDGAQIGLLLHKPNTPWQKGPDGRYRLI